MNSSIFQVRSQTQIRLKEAETKSVFVPDPSFITVSTADAGDARLRIRIPTEAKIRAKTVRKFGSRNRLRI